jgi:hypothetical protein
MAINKIMQELAEMGLYSAKDLDKETEKTLSFYLDDYKMNDLAIDLYCPYCKEYSTFNPSAEEQLRPKNVRDENSSLFTHDQFNFISLFYIIVVLEKKHIIYVFS